MVMMVGNYVYRQADEQTVQSRYGPILNVRKTNHMQECELEQLQCGQLSAVILKSVAKADKRN